MKPLFLFIMLAVWTTFLTAQNPKKIEGLSNILPLVINPDVVPDKIKESIEEEDITPPVLTILTTTLDAKPRSFMLKAKVTDNKSGVYQVIVDNKLVLEDKSGDFETEIVMDTPSKTVKIHATDKKLNRTVPIVLTFTREQLVTKTWTDYAVFFAIEDYQNEPKLSKPINDAQEMEKILRENYGFRTETHFDIDRKKILDVLNDYKLKFSNGTYEKDGQLLVFFSGHGYPSNKNGYFVPKNGSKDDMGGTSYSYDMLRGWVDIIDVKHLIVVVDACYSAYLNPDFDKNKGDADNVFKNPKMNIEQTFITQNKLEGAYFFLTSDDNFATTPDNSQLAFYMVDALKNNDKDYLDFDVVYTQYLKKAKPSVYSGKFARNNNTGKFLFIRTR